MEGDSDKLRQELTGRAFDVRPEDPDMSDLLLEAAQHIAYLNGLARGWRDNSDAWKRMWKRDREKDMAA
jgi:hypothetical protein